MKFIKFHTTIDSALILICLLAFWGGVVYKLYALSWPGVIVALILVIISFYCLRRFNASEPAPPPREGTFSLINLLPVLLYLAVIMILFAILLRRATTDAIISPWQAVPAYFFFLYALSTALLLFILTGRDHPYPLPATRYLLIIHYFLSFSIALIIYKIGYGFDPFIHRATEALIAGTGAVDPKPFYYLGQYGIIVILHKIFFVSISWLDKLLVPLLAAIFLPVYLGRFFRKRIGDNRGAAALVLLSLALPCSFFIVTTPQNLAFLFLLLAVVIGGTGAERRLLIMVYALAAAALLTQPIAGIPALLFAAALTIGRAEKKTLKRAGLAAVFVVAAVGLPLAFLFVEHGQTGAGGWQWRNLLSIPRSWPVMPAGNNFLFNAIYLYAFNSKSIYVILAAVGVWLAYKNKAVFRFLSPNLILAAGMVGAYFLSRALSFNYLIEYERTNFPGRLLIVAAIFVLPFALFAVHIFYTKLKAQNKRITIPFSLFAILLVTASLYISYPRMDDYFNSHGYSTSAGDIRAVRWIDQNATGGYIVLADQQTSAAALSEFGFKKYYQSQISNLKSQIFYYPIPTGGPLYRYYLDMVYEEPARETVEQAMDLAGVNEAYFALDKYWWASPKILEEAKLSADAWQSIDNGEVYVFKYDRRED